MCAGPVRHIVWNSLEYDSLLSLFSSRLFFLSAFGELPAHYFPEFYRRQTGSHLPLARWGFDSEDQVSFFLSKWHY